MKNVNSNLRSSNYTAHSDSSLGNKPIRLDSNLNFNNISFQTKGLNKMNILFHRFKDCLKLKIRTEKNCSLFCLMSSLWIYTNYWIWMLFWRSQVQVKPEKKVLSGPIFYLHKLCCIHSHINTVPQWRRHFTILFHWHWWHPSPTNYTVYSSRRSGKHG